MPLRQHEEHSIFDQAMVVILGFPDRTHLYLSPRQVDLALAFTEYLRSKDGLQALDACSLAALVLHVTCYSHFMTEEEKYYLAYYALEKLCEAFGLSMIPDRERCLVFALFRKFAQQPRFMSRADTSISVCRYVRVAGVDPAARNIVLAGAEGNGRAYYHCVSYPLLEQLVQHLLHGDLLCVSVSNPGGIIVRIEREPIPAFSAA